MAVTDQFNKKPTTISSYEKPLESYQFKGEGGRIIDKRSPAEKGLNSVLNASDKVGNTIYKGVSDVMDNAVVPAATSTYNETVGKVVEGVQKGWQDSKADAAKISANKTEWTAGGDNYWFGDNNQQGQLNALNGTGHVAGMPQVTLYTQGQGERLNTGTKGEIRHINNAQGTNIQPTVTTNQGATNRTVQPNVSNQQNTQPTQDSSYVDSDGYTSATERNAATNGAEFGRQEQATQNQDMTYNNNVIQNMESDLSKSTEGIIYGKVGPDSNGKITTLADENSVYKATIESRTNMVNSIISQDPSNIATLIAAGANPYSDTAMRDLMQYAPEYYQKVQQAVKNIQAGEKANAIASGVEGPDITGTSTSNTNSGVDSWAKGVSSTPQQTSNMITNISNSMSNNQVATTATQEMLNLNKQIAEYNEKINNLEKEARSAFKGDVPQYIVNAYVSNRRQQYQSEINKLEDRYSSALDLYKTELNNAQWEQEMNLKYLQYQQGVNNDAWTRYYQSQVLKQNSVHWVDGTAYQYNADGSVTKLNDNSAMMAYNQDVQSALQGYMSLYASGGATKTSNGYKYNVSGGQCETFTDNFTEATTGLRMTGEGGRGRTTAAEKIGYINSFVPEVGSVAVAVGGAYDSTYGHTMLVTGYDPSTGIVDLLWSNKDGDEMVYSTSAPLSKLQANGLKGFWNPYYDVAQTSSMGNYQYQGFNTPMANAFQRIANDSSLSATQKGELPIALEMYDTLYEIANNGQLDALVQNGDLALIMKDLKNSRFSNADKGEGFIDAFSKALNNKVNKLVGGDDSYLALMALQRIVEAKLRDESGAAISSSERATNFSYLLPQAGESNYVKQQKLNSWDRIISTKFITAGGKMDEYVPIFQDKTVRNIRAN